jgi:PAS domain S-box-containing protein
MPAAPDDASHHPMRIPELETIYQTAPVGLGVLDGQLRFTRINERLAQMSGRPAAAHIGQPVATLLPGLAPQAQALLRQVLASGEPACDVELHFGASDAAGGERIWRAQFYPLRDEGGAVGGISLVAEDISERRRAELGLWRSEANLQLAMEAGGLATWEWELQDKALRLGDGWARILGAPPNQRSYGQWRALLHPDDLPATLAALEAHATGRADAYEAVFRVQRADGLWIWVAVRGRIVERDEQARPLRMIGVARDVSAQREAEEHLREQALLLQLAFDGIFSWSSDGGIESWNRGAEQQYGYTADEALGRSPHELLDTRFPVSRDDTMAQLDAHGVWRGELSHRAKDGTWRNVSAVMQRLGDGRGRVLEITRDITAAKAAREVLAQRERDLLHSQQRLQVALDAGRMAVWDWVPGAPTSFWSAEMYRLLGLPVDPSGIAAPDDFLQRVHPEDRAALDAKIANALARGGDYEAEFRVLRADGDARWLMSRGRVTHQDDAGEHSRIVGVSFDISERKRTEQTLLEADNRRTEFLAMLAHELRNPLAPISNVVRLLEKVGDDPERREAATQILRRQTAHMARLVDDLLEISRITQGRIELRMENVLVATCVFQAVEAARLLARQRQQTLAVDVPPSLDLVADPARLTQVVSNLVTNAVKYTPEGGTVAVSAMSESDEWVSIIVQDNGPGISPDLMPHLFEMFTQDRRTLDRSQGGLGIGLALVKRLTELHGGHVRCESTLGHGARFVVCLPRHGRREQLRGSSVSASSAQVPPMPLLVVDDNVDAAQTLATLLRLDGHRVEVAHDGEQALSAAQELRPKAVLLDLGLPRLDGLTVAQRLRADRRFDDTVLVAMSGYAQARDREATARAGFDAHFAKPVDLADIYRVIEAALARRGG